MSSKMCQLNFETIKIRIITSPHGVSIYCPQNSTVFKFQEFQNDQFNFKHQYLNYKTFIRSVIDKWRFQNLHARTRRRIRESRRNQTKGCRLCARSASRRRWRGAGRARAMLWRAYTAALQSHPLRTNAASSGFIGFCGDAIAQRIEHNSAETSTKKQQWWDSRRAAMLSIWGVFGNGIPGTLWFRWLSLRIPVYLPRPGESKTALHLPSLCRLLAVHLCTYAPASNTVFYGYKEAFSGDAATWAARYELGLVTWAANNHEVTELQADGTTKKVIKRDACEPSAVK